MGVDPAALFHVVELFLTEKKGFTSVASVDPTHMAEGFILGHGVRKGKAAAMRVSREDLEEFGLEMKEKESGQQAEAGE